MSGQRKGIIHRTEENSRHYLCEQHRSALLENFLRSREINVFEYYKEEDRIVIYDDRLCEVLWIENYMWLLEEETRVPPEEKWKLRAFFEGGIKGSVEIQTRGADGGMRKHCLNAVYLKGDGTEKPVFLGTVKDVTAEKQQEEKLKDRARRDSLTQLYNQETGKELIQKYLLTKDPFASCGMMLIDIDYFKNVNDNYGHLFGDTVLIELARVLTMMCEEKDIVIRAGGDEFMILYKDISHNVLVKKAVQLVETVRKLRFEEENYAMSCSVGVCFLPEPQRWRMPWMMTR